ncbi:hypothetical protein [Rhizocola hellebori]|uniref:hypothetical protein n=1 Tax=Rhizocola hellebori TaxID=1392758 RepID=UPI0019415E95|nr:hypothetical protein [Rhizocola hellebori]
MTVDIGDGAFDRGGDVLEFLGLLAQPLGTDVNPLAHVDQVDMPGSECHMS